MPFNKQRPTSSELVYSNEPLCGSSNPIANHPLSDTEAIQIAAKLLREEIGFFEGVFSSWRPLSEELRYADYVVPRHLG